MKKSLRILVLTFATLMAMVSCEFDHLHYETNLVALINIEVDWAPSQAKPNGVTAYVFDAEGNKYTTVLSSNPELVQLRLPAGDYSVVLHNNSLSELKNVELKNRSTLNSFGIYATEATGTPRSRGDDFTETFINEPGEVITCTLHDIHIDAADIKYHYNKPNLEDYEQEVFSTYYAEPKHVVHLCRVIAHIDGLEYAAGAPVASLRGMSGGYHFGQERNTDGDVLEEFYVNTRVSKGDDDENGPTEIYVDYNTFAMHTTDSLNQRYHLDLRFKLLDGSNKDYALEVTDSIRTEYTPIKRRHIIEVTLDPLPETEGGGDNPDPDDETGVFDPTLDDWKDIVVTLPM